MNDSTRSATPQQQQERRGSARHETARRRPAVAGTGNRRRRPRAVALVEAYLKFCRDWDLHAEYVESAVYSVTHGYAGTLDLIATLRDGKRWLLDLKTSKGVYGDMALQQAAYRFAEYLAIDDGEHIPCPRSMRSGSCMCARTAPTSCR